MEPKDPLSQAQEVLDELSLDVAAEAAKNLAEMILLSAITGKNAIQAKLLYETSQQGVEYTTGVLVAIGVTARSWTRRITGDPLLDLIQYINPESEPLCHVPDGGFSHHVVVETFKVEQVAQADDLRREIIAFAEKSSLDTWGAMVVHVIHLFSELVECALDVCNGDYVPEGDDDRRLGT